LDISCCGFGSKDIQTMNVGLRFNHKIMGIHVLGNKAKVDGLGYLEPEEE